MSNGTSTHPDEHLTLMPGVVLLDDFGKLGERLGRDVVTSGNPARRVVNLPVVLVELGALRLG
jgi:hypothetical protein